MAGGGKMTIWNVKARELQGKTDDTPASNGQVEISAQRGAVTLSHPERWADVRVRCPLQPKVEIVRLLLAYGASVTNVELKFGRSSLNPEFFRLLESHQRNPIPRRIPASTAPSPLELGDSALVTKSKDLANQLAFVEMEVRKKELQNQAT
ncbi:hypothetical protein M427DRAFT_43543 [Gonapodya prolifera JEL478]|uniref:Uncharacterized protein n=1 Tax=Gonapodya prolifera (strain JEL478) TaxID=1344416 RepID=A0A139AHZ6_GONPJ|nr:hypothetical protein M427DRAFT_43543 [Gonapodya prolifera JEL478]|eukprot:KXS16451.1 hypothetical protein M427DRAFT_43543 [Gonapodya prolifera JEL478]